ncbi:MAG: DNA primase, partial [Lachnospiraceae bacterium]|nr:DNA primase [Lachnospiraceae bacterium]
RDAVTGIVFEVDTISGNYNLKDPEEKIKFTKDVAKRLYSIEEPVASHSYIDAVADKYNLDRDGLMGMVTKYGTIEAQGALTEAESAYDRNNIRSDERGNNDLTKTQKLLLTWMINDTRLFEILEDVISEEDFYDEDIYPVAACLFAQYRDTGTVKPAAILDKFDDVDKQRIVAGIMQTELPFEMDDEEEERAINDLVRKTKISYIDWKLPQCTSDVKQFQELIKMKAKVSKLHISLKNG